MKAISLFLAGALAFATPAIVSGRALAQTAVTTYERIVVPQMSEPDLNLMVKKNNAFVELLNTSQRALDSYNRYLSWVNAKTGPTGKERIVYGLYSVSPELAARAIDRARAAAHEKPSIEAYDKAAEALASSFEALVPILNEVEAYYDRQDYKADKFAGARSFHEKLMPFFEDFLADRQKLYYGLADVREGIDKQLLDKIEVTEGKSYRWHKKRVLMAAEKVLNVVPRETSTRSLAAYDEALGYFATVVKEFDTYSATAKDKGLSVGFESMPRSLLGDLRDLRDQVNKGTQQVFYSMYVDKTISAYNMMTSMAKVGN